MQGFHAESLTKLEDLKLEMLKLPVDLKYAVTEKNVVRKEGILGTMIKGKLRASSVKDIGRKML